METNTSENTIGGVLSQEQEGEWRPIAFLSRIMQQAERNYKIYNKELLAIVEVLAKWRQYLLDVKELFEIWMDYKNLKYFREPHKLNRRQARWYLKLQDYDFILQYVFGKTNTKVYILSRKDQIDTWEDNKNVQMLKEELWTRRITAEITVIRRSKITEDSELLKEIWRNNTKEHEVEQELKKNDGTAWEQNRITYVGGRIYILNNKLKKWILWENHDPVDVGHLGQQRMIELVKRNYWWPELKQDIKKYIQGCFKCQQNKV